MPNRDGTGPRWAQNTNPETPAPGTVPPGQEAPPWGCRGRGGAGGGMGWGRRGMGRGAGRGGMGRGQGRAG